jgi:hypothetical protein
MLNVERKAKGSGGGKTNFFVKSPERENKPDKQGAMNGETSSGVINCNCSLASEQPPNMNRHAAAKKKTSCRSRTFNITD